MFKTGLLIACLSIFVIWVTQGSTFPPSDEPDTNSTLVQNATKKRILTPEENEMANAARAHIAKVLEKNLIRFFAAISVQQRQSRQEEDDIDDEDTTFNPNTLPQVAQLLGAIFSGNLNLTSVVDQAFYLVPQNVRNQVSGIFKLLGGTATEEPPVEAPPTSLNASAPRPRPRPRPKVTTTTEGAPDAAAFVPPVAAFDTQVKSKTVKPKPSWKAPPTAAPLPEEDVNFQDDELIHLEKELVMKAKEYAPIAKKKEPRFFVNSLQQLLQQNLTQVVRIMPDLFKGARQAFVLLDELGVIPDDFLVGIGLDADDEDD
jgi:hypothetical protein